MNSRKGDVPHFLGMDDATFEKLLVDSALPSFFNDSFWKSAEVVGGKYIAVKPDESYQDRI